MFMKEKYKQKNVKKEGGRGEEKKLEEKKMRKKKRMRDSLDPGKSGLSHFEEGFPKILRKWIPGFGGRKKGRQRGSSRGSYRYERCVLLPFLLSLSLPLTFVS